MILAWYNNRIIEYLRFFNYSNHSCLKHSLQLIKFEIWNSNRWAVQFTAILKLSQSSVFIGTRSLSNLKIVIWTVDLFTFFVINKSNTWNKLYWWMAVICQSNETFCSKSCFNLCWNIFPPSKNIIPIKSQCNTKYLNVSLNVLQLVRNTNMTFERN